MSNEIRVTIIGRLTAAPELRFAPSGAAVANLTIASNARRFDKQASEWVDEPATFWRCNIWREAAENCAESLDRGTAVIAHGVLKSREFQTKEGEKRTVQEIELEAIGPDLRWQAAKVVRVDRRQSSGGGTGGQRAQGSDPWAAPAPSGGQGGWGSGGAGPEEPPFVAPPVVIS